MTIKPKLIAGLSAIIILASSTYAAAPVTGRWITQEKNAVVEIYPCGATICGKIAKFLVIPPAGVGAKDVKNPNAALRDRTILGMNILTNFTAKGEQWNGTIYDPKAGKAYRSVVYKGTSGNLIVKGCIGPFCKSQTWTAAR